MVFVQRKNQTPESNISTCLAICYRKVRKELKPISKMILTIITEKKTHTKKFHLIFNLIVKIGGPCTSNRLSFRFVAGAWSLTAFIFVQAYNSTLLTYVLTPINNPLINSPYDIPERKDVHLLIKKGGSTDIFLSAS